MNDIQLTGPHKNFEGVKKIDENGIDYWEARELMPLLGYTKWDNFLSVIEKAKIACRNSEQTEDNHFAGIGKMIRIATGTDKETSREIKDYKLSRYACYLIAQNGDTSKKAIATAQTYFAIQTRKQEIFQQLDDDGKRLFLRGDVKTHNKKLNTTAQNAGVRNFGKFNNAGYVGLYGMRKASVQKRKGIGKDDVLDRAGVTELAANLFRITQTDEKIVKDNIKGEGKASAIHLIVAGKVRKSIKDIGGTMPEDLIPEEHIKKIEQKRKKILDTFKKTRISAKK